MIFHSSKLMLTAVLSSICVNSAVPAEAGCHGRSGGGQSYSSRYSSRTNYPRPVYSSPVYSQPVYPQPVHPQPVYPPTQPIYGQTQPLPPNGPGQQSFPARQVSPAQQGFPPAGQTVQAGSQPGSFANGPAAGSTMMAGQSQIATPGAAAPGASTDQTGGVQAPNNGSPITSSVNDAQQSALKALGGFAPPQNTTVVSTTSPTPTGQNVQTQQPSFAGTWTANLPNGARIQLALQADGNFSWTAVNKDGKSSIFQGTYAIENGSLSLTRSNDNQKLSGSVTTTGANTFNFKLSVAQSSSLDFVRG